jgi:hypothetical protein
LERGARLWRARGARAYNGGLGAEPPVGSRGKAPGGGQGAKPPEAGDILRSKSSISAVKIHDFANLSNVCMPPLMKQTWQSVHSDKAPGA